MAGAGTTRGRPFVVAWRDGDTEEALRTAHLTERDGTLRSRLRALWLLRSGQALAAVAAVLGVHYRSVQRWVAWYRQGGRPSAAIGWAARASPPS